MILYDGVGTDGHLLGSYSGSQNIQLIESTTGPFTIKFYSAHSYPGFEFFISCNINTPQNTIYNLIKDNNCRMITCDNNWRNIQ